MRTLMFYGCLVICGLMTSASAAQSPDDYPLHEDANQQAGVPQGKLLSGQFQESALYPGTTRDYWVYVPQQYDGVSRTALMVFQDGQNAKERDSGLRVPNIFDNLIHRGDMPVTIGVFVTPGVVPAANASSQARFNRSFEYDRVDDRYARFLIEELLPHIQQRHGLSWSDEADDRGLCGVSSGGICAFTAAWYRPDQFRRVISGIGTFVGLRGGHEFSTLIRKTEPKPLRVFLQDGTHDLDIYGGDWWVANQAMLRSLQFSGYEVQHVWGEGGHNTKHLAAILPDALRWLWHDHGRVPVAVHPEDSQNETWRFIDVDSDWEVVSEGHQWAEGLAVTDDGTLYFTDVPASKLYRLSPDGTQTLLTDDTGQANGIALGPDGRLYGASSGAQQIRAWDLGTLEMEVVAEGTASNDIVVLSDGTIYYTDPAAGKVWRLDAKTKARSEADVFPGCNGIGLSADQSQLFVADFDGRFIYAYTIQPDGTLTNKEPFFHLEVPTSSLRGHLDGMCSTEDGWLVATSELGVQICDQPGRSHVILPMPVGSQRACYVAFGGPERKTLYVANVDKILKRKTKLVGARPWAAPVKPPQPRL